MVEAIDASSTNYPDAQIQLSERLYLKYENLHNLEDLDEAIGSREKAVQGLSSDPPKRRDGISVLANMLVVRFRRTASMKDLDEAIEKTQLVVSILPEKSPMRCQ